jgi:hypothetical protein
MRRPLLRTAVATSLVLVGLAVPGCNGVERGSGSLSPGDIRAALEKLPYRYEYRDVRYSGHGAVVAGKALLGPHLTYFALIAGDPIIDGRAIPRQRLPNGGFQHGVDETPGPGFVAKYVYTRTSIPRISGDIDLAICEKAGGDAADCRDL